MALAVALSIGAPATAQPTQPALAAAPTSTRYPLATDDLSAPSVPPRTAYQPARQPPGVPDQPDFTLPDGSVIPVPQGKAKHYRFAQRYGTRYDIKSSLLPEGARRFVITVGVIVNATGENGEEI